ncbi:MAG: type IV toxin-antitoxin system AbiEi family antitoxin [Actinomycetota bacterium]
MQANSAPRETDLVQKAFAWLRATLPPTWAVDPSSRLGTEGTLINSTRVDAAVEIRPPGGVCATLVIEAKRTFGPRDVERLMGGLSRSLRSFVPDLGILVIAPWLSLRTRELLAKEEINYVDLTGNAYLRIENPFILIKTDGAQRDPSPTARGPARLSGARAARLIRMLIDVRPPYGVRDIATATELNAGYVSRLLETLDSEALIKRSPRGGVDEVAVLPLLRRWAQIYDVFKTNETLRFIAAGGAGAWLDQLRESSTRARWAVTGSFAAVRLSPVAAPTLLTVYTDDPGSLAKTLRLLPASEGANVLLMRPFDTVVWDRGVRENDVTYVSPSQIAVDCLTGVGRMPSEGEAILSWMNENESIWRADSLQEVSS